MQDTVQNQGEFNLNEKVKLEIHKVARLRACMNIYILLLACVYRDTIQYFPFLGGYLAGLYVLNRLQH